MNVVRPDFPEIITNSMRSDFLTCPRKFELNNLYHYKPKTTSIHLHAGGAFAKGIEATRRAYYEAGLPAELAVEHGWLTVVEAFGARPEGEEAHVKTAESMASALLYYFDAFPLATDFVTPATIGDSRGTEFSFVIPLPIEHPQTGDPLLLGGRFDMLGQHKNGDLYVVDEKTTSKLGGQWIESWKLDAQFTEYCFAAREYGHEVVGAIVRGISILKNGHGHAQSIQMRPQWVIERWYDQLLLDIERMIASWDRRYFDYNLSYGCKMYGGCQYTTACASPHPQRWLDEDFIVAPYNPYGSPNGQV